MWYYFNMTAILTALMILQMQQLINRLFPFGRGLCHAYWAPNFWVFYIILDKIFAFLLRRLGFNIAIPEASFTGGLVGDSSPFAVLLKVLSSTIHSSCSFCLFQWNMMGLWFHICELNGLQVTPIATFLLVILAMAPCLIKAFSNPQPKHIIRWVSYACTCGFMFGWHVHEKASLHFTIPLALISMDSLNDARHYFLLSICMFCSWLQFNVTLFHLWHFLNQRFWVPFLSMKKRFFCNFAHLSICIIPILCFLSSIMIVMSEMW